MLYMKDRDCDTARDEDAKQGPARSEGQSSA